METFRRYELREFRSQRRREWVDERWRGWLVAFVLGAVAWSVILDHLG